MGQVSSHCAFLRLNQVRSRCLGCSQYCTRDFQMFDVHRPTREERFPVNRIVSLIEVDSLFFLAFFFSSTSMSGQLGLRLAWKIGRLFLSFRPMSNSGGEYPPDNGVDLYANSPLVGSLSFLSSDLAVLKARSTSPLDCGKRGLLLECLKPHSFSK